MPEHDIETSVTTSEKGAPSTSGSIVKFEALPNETAAVSEQSESWEIEVESSEGIDVIKVKILVTPHKLRLSVRMNQSVILELGLFRFPIIFELYL